MLQIFNKKKFNFDNQNIKSKAILNAIRTIEKDESSNLDAKPIIRKPKSRKKLIEVKHLTKTFSKGNQKKTVLNDIRFDIYEDEHVAILGGNGAGKTTLVEIIVGLMKATDGDIKINYKYKNNYLEKIGIQFQDSSYPPGISVKNIIDFMIGVYKIDINQDELLALLKIFGIISFYNKRASSLSGGQLQRLNALISIIQKPKILFLDELSTGLDITIRTQIREFILNYAKENGMTIVLVSHDMGEVDYLCNRIIFLKHGKIIVDTEKKEIIKKYGTLEKFMNKYIK